jgi:hypothetical protein
VPYGSYLQTMHDWALADAWDLTTLHYARYRFLPRAVRQADSMPNGRIGWAEWVVDWWTGGMLIQREVWEACEIVR